VNLPDLPDDRRWKIEHSDATYKRAGLITVIQRRRCGIWFCDIQRYVMTYDPGKNLDEKVEYSAASLYDQWRELNQADLERRKLAGVYNGKEDL